MQLTLQEQAMITRLVQKIHAQRPADEVNRRYWRGLQQITHLGISVPADAAAFAFPLNWSRVFVEACVERMDVRMILREGESSEDSELRSDWQASDMHAQLENYCRDLIVLGRGVITVASRGEGNRPSIRVESPTNLAVEIDPVTRETLGAVRMYTDAATGQVQHLTLYLPNETVSIDNRTGRWEAYSRTEHYLGRVPVVMATWHGSSDDPLSFETAISDIKRLVDMSARVLLNLQVAMETVATPQKVITGVAEAELQGEDGELIDAGADPWERYLGAVWMIANSNAKVTQLPGSDLDNFLNTITMLAEQAATLTGLPGRMLGQNTANPPTEGSLKGDEVRLVRGVELMSRAAGSGLAWALAISERLRTGAWPEHGSISVAWHNPATPTEAQRADALTKATGGKPYMSVRGAMSEMGWSQPRIDQELEWLDQEARGEYAYLDTSPGAVISADDEEVFGA